MQGDPKDAVALYNSRGESRVVFSEIEETKVRAEGFTLKHEDLPFEMKEYPKSLYQAGDRTQQDCVVRNADEERAQRAKGFKQIDPKRDAAAVTALGLDPKPADVEKEALEPKEPFAKGKKGK